MALSRKSRGSRSGRYRYQPKVFQPQKETGVLGRETIGQNVFNQVAPGAVGAGMPMGGMVMLGPPPDFGAPPAVGPPPAQGGEIVEPNPHGAPAAPGLPGEKMPGPPAPPEWPAEEPVGLPYFPPPNPPPGPIYPQVNQSPVLQALAYQAPAYPAMPYM